MRLGASVTHRIRKSLFGNIIHPSRSFAPWRKLPRLLHSFQEAACLVWSDSQEANNLSTRDPAVGLDELHHKSFLTKAINVMSPHRSFGPAQATIEAGTQVIDPPSLLPLGLEEPSSMETLKDTSRLREKVPDTFPRVTAWNSTIPYSDSRPGAENSVRARPMAATALGSRDSDQALVSPKAGAAGSGAGPPGPETQ